MITKEKGYHIFSANGKRLYLNAKPARQFCEDIPQNYIIRPPIFEKFLDFAMDS